MSSDRLPIFPLPHVQLFPHALVPLHVFEPRYRELVRDCLKGDQQMALAMLIPGNEDAYYERPPVHAICGVGRIIAHDPLPDGRSNILLRGEHRARILEELPPKESYRLVRAEPLADVIPATLDPETDKTLVLLADQLAQRLPAGGETLRQLARSVAGPGALTDVLSAALVTDADERQRLLAELDVGKRAEAVIAHLGALLQRIASPAGPSN
jgi:Lon protease-like protein